MKTIIVAIAFALLAGCSMIQPRTVVTDVQTTDKPVATKCTIKWPPLPTPHVMYVQRTGDDYKDAILVWRAMEAELEERIAYTAKLEAAASACLEGGP